ncbi:MAG: 50S ribosomal protein L7/L12 [bacterium]
MAIEGIIEEIGKLSVMELAELVKALEGKFGVSAAAPVAAVAAAPVASQAASAEEEKTEFKVTLKDGGGEKIKVIKALRSVTSLSLKDAKDMVEGAPAVIAEAASKEDAKKMKETLEAAGAKVELS